MRILFDHQVFSWQQVGGISRYFFELISALEQLGEMEPFVSIKYSNNQYLSGAGFTSHQPFFADIHFKGKIRLQSYLNKQHTLKSMGISNFNIFHPTYYDPYFLNKLSGKPFVLTIYDMIHEKFSECFPNDRITSARKKLLADKADRIIAISENTRKDIIELFNIRTDKIEVIHLGNSLLTNSSVNGESNISLPENYILFVGSRAVYKNFSLFVKAITPLLSDDVSLYLVCAGGGAFTHSEKAHFIELGIMSKILQYNLTDKELATAYAGAACFVFPSMYEGFGIPVLESFACRCPLVCSNTSSLPEIASDAAVYFDPKSESEIMSAVQKVIYDEQKRENMRTKGSNRLKDFSWLQTAQKTQEVYKSLM